MALFPLLLALATVSQGASSPVPDGARLRPGAVCYAIVQDGRTIGATLQTIRATRADGKRAWEITVHQRVGASFDMRDHFIVARGDLRPIAFDSRKGSEGDKGWHRIAVRYTADRITGTRADANGSRRIDVPLTGAVWEGNLWGVTFGALPLTDGARLTLPVWQYDKGFGRFIVNVVGRERVETQNGPIDAWIVEAGDDPSRLARYRLGVKDGAELGYSADGFAQRPGGDCAGLD